MENGPGRSRAAFGLTLAIAALLVFGQTPTLADTEKVLSDNDVGRADDMTTPGRWGKPAEADGRTYRTYTGPRSLSYVAVRPWFEGDAPAESSSPSDRAKARWGR